MDPLRNPYTPGAGISPPALVGRDRELERFDIAAQRLMLGRSARSVMLTGLRGVGKTILLREFARIAEGHGWAHQHHEALIQGTVPFPRVMARLVRQAILRISAGERFADRAQRALGVLKAFQVQWKLPGAGDLMVGIDPEMGWADSGLLDHDLADLFTEVGELARDRGLGALFTIDEAQYLPKGDLSALITALHRIAQEQLPLLVAIAGLPSLVAAAADARSYSERLFEFRVINSLTPAEAGSALSEPSEAEGVRWHPEALEQVVSLTEGYPYFLQEFGKQAWDVAEGPDEITSDDTAVAIPLAIDELDTGFYRVRIDRTTDAERAYLAAMASLGSGPYRSGRVAAAMGKSTTQVSPHRNALIRKGLCYSVRHGTVAFSVPKFDDFVRRDLR